MAKNFLISISFAVMMVCEFFFVRWIYDRPVAPQVTPPDTSYSVVAVVDTTKKDTTIYVPRFVPKDSLVYNYRDTTVYNVVEIPAGAPYAEDKITVLSPAKITTRYYLDKGLFSHSISYLPVSTPAPVDKTLRWTAGLFVNGGYPQYAGAGIYYHRIDKGILIGVDGGYKHWGVTVGVDLLKGKGK